MLDDMQQTIDQLYYTNSEPWVDQGEDTEAASGSHEVAKNVINKFWTQMTNGIDKAINSLLHTRMSSTIRMKQTNKKPLDYIAAKHTSKLYKLLKDLKRFHEQPANTVGTEDRTSSLMDTERYWNIKLPKYNRDYNDASISHFSEQRNFRITDLDIKDPRSISKLEEHIQACREMD
ncbi:hypothetical protein RclHR1_17590001 [Rhizophagus clarus]|uniref:Uncharacterized protein n=1 Tax=Rhizophagus clarus TaxID=94130 RepID=A0A2Z6QPA8_9GLOM|nr:hypothetical protein RclHR1_17590001 [Rhizophagus clarus]